MTRKIVRGIVQTVGRRNGLLAVFTEQGEYTVIEIVGTSTLTAGDAVMGELEVLGQTTLTIVRSRQAVPVDIQDCHCNGARVRQLLEP